jgi:signal transduction histidine kinase
MAANLPSITLVPVDLSALAADAARRHADMARRAGCAMSVSIAPDVVVQADAGALHRVLNHLLTNAFRFGSGRPVRLELAMAASFHAVLTVHDQGSGLSREEAGRIFGLFQNDRMAAAPGLGLGLWIASQLVTAMGGTIGVDSTPGQGAHFHVSLPR